MTSRKQRNRPRGMKLWAFRLVAALFVPALLLALLEAGLRVCGYGVPMDFALRQEVAGEERILSNPYFTWRFFDPRSARSCTAFSLPAKKAPNEYRVFVLGASAAKGDPAPAYGLARVLEVMLRERYPGTRFRVVDVAAVAINSHAVLPIARACAGLDPDLFVVYLGNNEVVGPYGPGTSLAPWRRSLFGIRAGIGLKGTRLGQLMVNTQRRLHGEDRGPHVWTGMEMFLDRRVRASDPKLQRTYEHFAMNLADICRAGRGAGVPVVLSTVGTNLRDCAPFASLHRKGMSDRELGAWEVDYAGGVELQAQGAHADAIRAYLKAEQADDEYADLQFRLGRCYGQLGEFDKAHERYAKARDLDTLRFRADTRINEIIRETAAAQTNMGVHLVDAARGLAHGSPHRTPGHGLFHEHVHLEFPGTYLVASSVVARCHHMLPPRIREQAEDYPTVGEEDCAGLIAYTWWDHYRIAEYMLDRLRKAPFTAQLDHDEQLARLSGRLARLKALVSREQLLEASRQYEAVMCRPHVHWQRRMRYAMLQAHGLNDLAEAERQWRKLVAYLPQDAGLRARLGEVLSRRGGHAEAEASFRAALTYQPCEPTVLSNLGAVLQARGKLAEAVSCLEQAVATDPDAADAHYNLAVCLLLMHPDDGAARSRAAEHCRKALAIDPDDAECHGTLVKLYLREAMAVGRTGDHRRAQEFLRAALAMDPLSEEAHYNLAASCDQLGDRQGAVKHLAEVLRINPRNNQARVILERFRKQ